MSTINVTDIPRGAVLVVGDLPIDFEQHPWWLVTFNNVEAVRLVVPPNPLRVAGLVSRKAGAQLEWAVLSRTQGDLEPIWRRYVVGLQKMRGVQGAPLQYERWSVHFDGAALLHEFELSPVHSDPISGRLYHAEPWISP